MNRIIMLLNAFYTECALGIKNEIILFYCHNGIYSSVSYFNIQERTPIYKTGECQQAI